MSRKYTPEKRIAAFHSKTDKSSGLFGCWLWTGATNGRYGGFWWNDKMISAHRVAWEIAHGEIPSGLYVCHHCDNPRCVNPSHLFLGTSLDNNRDMIRKGRNRSLRNEESPACKFSDAVVAEIRTLYSRGGITQQELGNRFGVSLAHVSFIVNKRSRRF